MSESENESGSKNENKNENESESKSDNNDCERYQDHKIKQLHNYFKEIGETKSLEEQIELLKKRDCLDEYWHKGYYHGNKELNLKIFNANLQIF